MKVIRSLENIEILAKVATEKIVSQEGGSLSSFFGLLLKVGLSSTKNVTTQLAKSVLITLGLTTEASATYAATQKKIYGSGMNALMFYLFLFINLFNIDNLQILRYCKKLKNTIAYHISK